MKKIIDSQQIYALEEHTKEHAYLTRRQLSILLGGLISPRTLANWDSRGNGPAVKVTLGRTIGYPRAEAIAWLKSKMVMK